MTVSSGASTRSAMGAVGGRITQPKDILTRACVIQIPERCEQSMRPTWPLVGLPSFRRPARHPTQPSARGDSNRGNDGS